MVGEEELKPAAQEQRTSKIEQEETVDEYRARFGVPRLRPGGRLAAFTLTMAGLSIGVLLAKLEEPQPWDHAWVLWSYAAIGFVVLVIALFAGWHVLRVPVPGEVEVPVTAAAAHAATWWRSRLTYGVVLRGARPVGIKRITDQSFDLDAMTYFHRDNARQWNPTYIPKCYVEFYNEGNPEPIAAVRSADAPGRPNLARLLNYLKGDYILWVFNRGFNVTSMKVNWQIVGLVLASVVAAVVGFLYLQGRL